MSKNKGFTLIEIIVALVIIGVLAAIAFPSYTTLIEQGRVKNAEYNLMAIANAQQVYYYNNGQYCLNANGCGTLTQINSKLSLNIADSQFQYMCYNPVGSSYYCEADGLPMGPMTYGITIDYKKFLAGPPSLTCVALNMSYCP
jgi:type II secretion system protein G